LKIFYDGNHFTSKEIEPKEPKVLQHERTRKGGGSFPLQMGKEEMEKVSENAAQENSFAAQNATWWAQKFALF
jgi:hypothetical protein